MLVEDTRAVLALALHKLITSQPEGLSALKNTAELIEHGARQGEGSCYLDVTESIPYDMQLNLARYLQCKGYTVRRAHFKQRDRHVDTFKVTWMPEISGEYVG